MTSAVFPDPSTPFGARVADRLRNEMIIWVTTVGADGTPQPNPVWFLREDDTILIYNRADAHRLAHLRRHPRVALHLESDRTGNEVIVLAGNAEIVEGHPLASEHPAFLAKYEAAARRVSGDPQAFAEAYRVAVRVRVTRVRGF